jgi:hypothetical protein
MIRKENEYQEGVRHWGERRSVSLSLAVERSAVPEALRVETRSSFDLRPTVLSRLDATSRQ